MHNRILPSNTTKNYDEHNIIKRCDKPRSNCLVSHAVRVYRLFFSRAFIYALFILVIVFILSLQFFYDLNDYFVGGANLSVSKDPKNTDVVLREAGINEERDKFRKKMRGMKGKPKKLLKSMAKSEDNFDPLTGLKNGIKYPTEILPPASGMTSTLQRRRLDSVGIITTTNFGWDELYPWIRYHTHIGITAFFIFCEHPANLWSSFVTTFKTFKHDFEEGGVLVHLVYKTPTIERIGHITEGNVLEYCADREICARVVREGWLKKWFNGVCNAELFVRQSLNMEEGIDLALKLKDAQQLDWVAHIDSDELIYPGIGGVGSTGDANLNLRRSLSLIPNHVNSVVLSDWEGAPATLIPENSSMFEAVTLFKKNHMDTIDALPFLTYTNGKSIARLTPTLRSNGAHRFKGRGTRKKWKELGHAIDIVVLHYSYSKPTTAQKRGESGFSCGCSPTLSGAASCFILKFDQEVFIKSVLAMNGTISSEEFDIWYRRKVVYSDSNANKLHLKSGRMARLTLPGEIFKLYDRSVGQS